MPIREISHPLIRHKIGLMRRADISTKTFRELAQEVGALLTYEATNDLPLEHYEIQGWAGPVQVEKIAGKKITVVPILRAGITMADAMMELAPAAQVWHLGLYRDETTHRPVSYYNRLPPKLTVDVALVLDPMLATGGSAIAAVDVLKNWGVPEIRFVGLIAAPEGVAALHERHPDVRIYIASVDDHLNDDAFIVPGLGDAGDRLFGTK